MTPTFAVLRPLLTGPIPARRSCEAEALASRESAYLAAAWYARETQIATRGHYTEKYLTRLMRSYLHGLTTDDRSPYYYGTNSNFASALEDAFCEGRKLRQLLQREATG